MQASEREAYMEFQIFCNTAQAFSSAQQYALSQIKDVCLAPAAHPTLSLKPQMAEVLPRQITNPHAHPRM